MKTAAQAPGHIPGLDLVRVFAVLNVSLYHYTGAFGGKWGWIEEPLIRHWSSGLLSAPAYRYLRANRPAWLGRIRMLLSLPRKD